MQKPEITTLGDLKSSGYVYRTVKEELRQNLIRHIKNGNDPFPGILGYDKTVRPQVERAILAGHNLLLLGLRGQAKTKFARLMVNLMDDYVPVIEGSTLNEDPLKPLTSASRAMLDEHGDETPVTWVHKSERLVEKLATPDVSVADLIGDIDPIKAANLKLSYADEGVIHFGLVPRANRGIFVINELPDLQPRIQVALLNILQERDIQIRGFNLRIPLDIQFVFTANPEDYTNRGNIITPLKDRIESQVITHYPDEVSVSKQITSQESSISEDVKSRAHMPEIAKDLLEIIAVVARQSEYIDQASGVSARLSITAMEQLMASAQYRLLRDSIQDTSIRVTDFIHIIPAMTGKLELVYEGEQLGAEAVSRSLIEIAIESISGSIFPNPNSQKQGEKDPYGTVRAYFGDKNAIELKGDMSDEKYRRQLDDIAGLEKLAMKYGNGKPEDKYFYMELALHALCGFEVLQRSMTDQAIQFEDPLKGLFD